MPNAHPTMPEGFTPYPWQASLASLVATTRPRISVAADPGAGKTPALFLAAERCKANTIVVISPAGRVCRQWAKHATDWGCLPRIVGGKGEGGEQIARAIADHLTPSTASGVWPRPHVVIIPWSRMQRSQDFPSIIEGLERVGKVDLLGVDESHYAQSAEDANRGKALLGYYNKRKREALKGVRHYARRAVGLTGTPATSDPKKLRCQMLIAGLDRDHSQLRNRYWYEERHWGGRRQYDYGARRELWKCDDTPSNGHEALVQASIMRVSRDEIRAQLPAHQRIMTADFTQAELSIPEGLSAWADAREAGQGTDLPMLEDLAEQRREQTEERAASIAEYAQSWHGEAPEGQMLVIWTMYQKSAEILAEACQKALDKAEDKSDRPAMALHGGMTDGHRAEVIRQACMGNVRVLVCTHASTGTGVDGLQRVACRALVAEAPWTPGECEQSEGRLYRTGQPLPVISEWIADGIEGAILRGIGFKAARLGEALASAREFQADDVTHAPATPDALAPVEQDIEPEEETDDCPECPLEGWTWRKSKRTGEWLIAQQQTGADCWSGFVVTVKTRAGKETKAELIKEEAGGSGWCLWSFKKWHDPDEATKREREYLRKRATLRGVDQFDTSPLESKEDMAAAVACWDAAEQLTSCDDDMATEENGVGWSKADVTLGRLISSLPLEFWTQAELAFARSILRKYSRTQMREDHRKAIWPDDV